MATRNTAILRITREIAEIQKNTDLSLCVAYRDENVKHVRALIIGPPETPYQFGFFEFNFKFPAEYPSKAPYVRAITTNNGQTRFNPNIYADGKVCLSILGTWPGEKGESWSTAQGLESTLISIQSLMSSNPYENEPGYEGETCDSKEAVRYAAKIRHEALRLTVIERLEIMMGLRLPLAKDGGQEYLLRDPTKQSHYSPADIYDGGESENDEEDATAPIDLSSHQSKITKQPIVASTSSVSQQTAGPAAKKQKITAYDPVAEENPYHADAQFDPFADLFKRRFLWYYDSYLKLIETVSAEKGQSDGTQFKVETFESICNGMLGKYEYSSLKQRLVALRKAIDDETTSWISKGIQAKKDGKAIAKDLEETVGQVRQRSKSGEITHSFEIELVDGNPFVWHLTVFGPYSTDLDGAIINVVVQFSSSFPDEQPRVNVQTALFHHRISPTNGVLCYNPSKPDDVFSHISTIVNTIVDDNPCYDPRAMVNPEAATLLWGGEDKKKIYRRKLRRSVQDSLE